MSPIDTFIGLANRRGSLDLRCQFQDDWTPYPIVPAGECRAELLRGRRA